MSKRAALSVLVLVSGCGLEVFLPGRDATGGGGGGGGAWEEPESIAPRMSSSLESRLDCYALMCPVAAGGTSVFTVVLNDATTVDAIVEEGPATIASWIETPTERHFMVTAPPGASGYTLFTLVSDAGDSDHAIETKPVADVVLEPGFAYTPAGSGPLALLAGVRDVAISIVGPDAETEYGDRLVDGSLVVTGEGLTPRAFDHVVLPDRLGTHTIDVSASSFGTRRFTAEVVPSIDRIETLVEGTPGVYKRLKVCFFPFRGDLEVSAPVTITIPDGSSRSGNCVDVSPSAPGTLVYTGTAGGLTQTVEVTVP